MFLRSLIEKLPLVNGLRSRLNNTESYSRQHLLAAICVVVIILSLTGAFICLAIREHRTDTMRDVETRALRLATGGESEVAQLESAWRNFLLTGQPADLQNFATSRQEFETWLATLSSVLKDDPARLKLVRKLGDDTQRWLTTTALPAIAAKQQRRPITLGTTSLEEVRRELARFAHDTQDIIESSASEARFRHLLQTVGVSLLSAFAVGFVAVSSWMSYSIFRRQLFKANAAVAQTRSIIDNTLDGVITVDDCGYIQSINPAAERMFSQPAKAVIGQSVSMLIPQRLFFQDMQNAGRGAIMAVGQRQGFYPFPIEVSLSAMEVSGRRHFVAIVRDVSERQRSEDALRQISIGVSTVTGEEFLRTVLKQLSKALSNDYAFLVELAGSGRDRVTTLAIAEQGNLRRTFEFDPTNTAFGEALLKGFRVYQSSVSAKFPEDSILQELSIEGFVAAPLTDHKGGTIGLIGVLDRKTLFETHIIESTLQIFAARAAAEIERKRSEEDLAAEKERLAVTLRSIADGFITIDNEGLVLMMNTIAERLTGWSQKEAAGKPLAEVFDLVSERNRKRCSHALQRIVETGIAEGLASPTILVAQDQSERLIESNAAPIRDRSNRKQGAVIVFRDVTEKLRLEQEQQKADRLESLGIMAGGIAHDFNNVLTAILGNISLTLMRPNLDSFMREHLELARQSVDRAQELAKKLLPFAKGGAPVRQVASIDQLLRDTLSLTLHGANVTCHYALPADLWPVEIDPGQISQVLSNIAINASQAMPAGGALYVTAENFELAADSISLGLRAGRWLKLSLHDEGIGIPEDYIKKVFDPYFTTKPKGSGLGLATAYSIIKNHGGIIGVDSPAGKGCTFTICLPASEKELKVTSAGEVPMAPANARVLVLDDEEVICMLVTCALEPLGYEVTETHDGVDALAAYEKALNEGRRYDLVISDLTIPGGMGGRETIKRLQEIDPGVRAIVSSGYANDPIMSQHEAYGFCGMIAKPYEIDALGRKVAEVLSAPHQSRVIFHDFDIRKTA